MKPLVLTMTTKQKLIGSLLISMSFGWVVLWWFIKTGYEVTMSARDASGHELGASFPITWGLLGIMVRNVSASDVNHRLTLSVIGCLTAHLAGLWVLWSGTLSSRAKTRFFLVQIPLFASGILGVVLWMSSLINGIPPEGKCIDADPWWATAFASWVVVSVIVAIMTWWTDRKTVLCPDYVSRQRAVFGDCL